MTRPPKPAGLVRRAETKATKRERIAKEDSLTPQRSLPADAPSYFKGHAKAEQIYREMMREFNDLDAPIVNRLDKRLLVRYCILSEQFDQLSEVRKAAFDIWEKLNDAWQKADPDMPIKERMEIAIQIQSALETVVKLDGRADRKAALLETYERDLYLTPRARAGAAPKVKEKAPEVLDPMEALLGQVNEFVNSDSQDDGQ